MSPTRDNSGTEGRTKSQELPICRRCIPYRGAGPPGSRHRRGLPCGFQFAGHYPVL